MKFLIISYPKLLIYFIPIRAKYAPEHCVIDTSHQMFLGSNQGGWDGQDI